MRSLLYDALILFLAENYFFAHHYPIIYSFENMCFKLHLTHLSTSEQIRLFFRESSRRIPIEFKIPKKAIFELLLPFNYSIRR